MCGWKSDIAINYLSLFHAYYLGNKKIEGRCIFNWNIRCSLFSFLNKLQRTFFLFLLPLQSLLLHTHRNKTLIKSFISQQLRGRARSTRRKGSPSPCKRTLFFPPTPRHNSLKPSAHTPFLYTAVSNIVCMHQLISTLEQKSIPAFSELTLEQFADAVAKSDRLATLANGKGYRLHESKSNVLNVIIERKALIATAKDQEKQICGLQSKILGAKGCFKNSKLRGPLRKRGIKVPLHWWT